MRSLASPPADWPEADVPEGIGHGLVSVLVAREHRRGKVSVTGYLVDVHCLGVKDVLGPRVMDDADLRAYVRSYFLVYEVLGQVWRGGPRQARLSQALAGVDVRVLDAALGRAAGELLGTTGLSDVIDAAVVLLANDGDDIVTSDRDDFALLASTSGRHVELVRP